MITILTPWRDQMFPTFAFAEGDPEVEACVASLTAAGITFRVVRG